MKDTLVGPLRAKHSLFKPHRTGREDPTENKHFTFWLVIPQTNCNNECSRLLT